MPSFIQERDATGKKKYMFPPPMDGMPEYYSPSFDPSTYIAPKGTRRCPKGDALKYDLGEVATCRSRPCHSPEGEPRLAFGLTHKNHFNLTRLGERTAMKYLDEALNLLKGPRRGELRLRVELRRGVRDWGDFYTCAGYRGSSYKLPQPCKVSFSDLAEIHTDCCSIGMPLVDRQDRKWWRVCEDARISSEKREIKRGLRKDFEASEAVWEDALASFPWGDDVEQLEVRLRAARRVVRNSCTSRGCDRWCRCAAIV